MSDRAFRTAAQMAIEAKVQENMDFLAEANAATLDQLRERQGAIRGLREAIQALTETFNQMHG